MDVSAEPAPARSGLGFVVMFGVAVLVFVLVAAANLGRASVAAGQPEAPVYLTSSPSAVPSVGPAATVASARSGVDAAWLKRVAARTGIPERALVAYAHAALVTAREDKGCHLGWNTLAAIGRVESDHGRDGGAVLGADGRSTPSIVGPVLADGHTRAVGPMQFLPSTWRTWGADGDADGRADPNQLDDAALAAAGYLCAAGGDLATGAGWTGAVFAYNHSNDYVDLVRATANAYATSAG